MFYKKKSVILKKENPTIFSNDDIIYKSEFFFKCLSVVLHKKTDLCIKRLFLILQKPKNAPKKPLFDKNDF